MISTLKFSPSFKYRGRATGDFNDLLVSGIYYTNNAMTANAPAPSNLWSYIIVLNSDKPNPSDDGYKVQIVLAISHIYYRVYSGSPASWGNWHTLQNVA